MTGLRIERSVRRAEVAQAAMATSKDVDEQQAAWEEFVADWRTALNQIAAAAKRAGRNDIATNMHIERETSAVLTYVWEARNAEEHTPDGTSESAVHKVTRPITLNGDPITINGAPLVLTGPETVLKFRPLQRRGQALATPQDEPTKVAAFALEFLQRCHARLQEA
jgi:hypothetical protein